MNIIEQIEKENLKGSVPEFNVGDTVKVSFKVIEGTKERIQAFEGIVIARKRYQRDFHRQKSFLRYRR